MSKPLLLPVWFRCLLIVGAVVSLNGHLCAERVKLAVSDLILCEALPAHTGEETQLEWVQTGSSMALHQLDAGMVDGALVLGPLDGAALPEQFTGAMIGVGGVFLAVHKDNPLQELVVEDLKPLLQSAREGSRIEWSALVDEPAWSLREVYWGFRMEEGSIGRLLWNHYCFGSEEVWPAEGSLPEAVPSDLLVENHLLILDSPAKLPADFRLLPIKLMEDAVAFPPSSENLFYGDYPLCEKLMLVVQSSKSDQAWLRAFYEADMDEVLEMSAFVPLEGNLKDQSLLVFDKGS